MYISANKVNVTHSYTPPQGSTSPSTAGQEETSGPPSGPKLKLNSPMKALSRAVRSADEFDFTEKDLSVSPKASLPP